MAASSTGSYRSMFVRSPKELYNEVNIPPVIVDYLLTMRHALLMKDVRVIQELYDGGWNDLTEKFFREKDNWPYPIDVEQLVDKADKGDGVYDNINAVFLCLYKEQYYRFLYGKMSRGPGLEARIQSYNNYNAFFLMILDQTGTPLDIKLPNVWLWDIIDEFIYQFQSYCLYKANPSKRDKDDFHENEPDAHDVWEIYVVLNMLYQLVNFSQINEQLEAMNAGRNPQEVVTNAFGKCELYFKLGYFSLIGLLRLHVLLADYDRAVYEVRNVLISPHSLYNQVPVCFVTIHYLLGFTHMMRRDYVQATRLFVNAILYIQKTKTAQARPQNHRSKEADKAVQYDVVGKTYEQIYHLLAMCQVLHPQRIDDAVAAQLTEKFADKMMKMNRGETDAFEHAFFQGSPKFIAPMSMFEKTNVSKEPAIHQTRVFMDDISQLKVIPQLRGYLKLYTSLSVAKLASLMELTEAEVQAKLMCFKHKLCAVTPNVFDDDLDREDVSADLDFYVDKDIIHVADTQVGRRVGEFFLKNVKKLQEIEDHVKKLRVTAPKVVKVNVTQPPPRH